jgi:hypothetical protein
LKAESEGAPLEADKPGESDSGMSILILTPFAVSLVNLWGESLRVLYLFVRIDMLRNGVY